MPLMTASHAEPALAELCDALIHSRQHIGPKRLLAPGPDEATLRVLLSAAAAAPDHQQLRPWRFHVLGPRSRARLGEAFAQALRERDQAASDDQLADARDKALRGPVLLLAVADLRADEPGVAEAERLVSLGAAIQNLLLAAQARGWGSGLTSGRAMRSAALREAFGLQPGEHAVCCITLGTVSRAKPARLRPAVDEIARWEP
jgi:nitroreductase